MDDIDELIAKIKHPDTRLVTMPAAIRLVGKIVWQRGEIERLRAENERLRTRLREQTDETQHAGERIDAAICDALAHLGIDIGDRVGQTPIEQIVGGVVVGLQTEVERLRAACRSVALQPCPRDTDGDGNCGRQLCPYCGEAIHAALAAGGEARP